MPGSVKCTYINNPHWQVSSFPSPAPQRDAIYIWHGVTANLLHLYTECYGLVNSVEQAKANRYLQTADRQRYIIQHGLLRLLLGWYLTKPVFADVFAYGAHGKPYLADNDVQPCFFNLSNSAGEFIIALGDKELGVDLEHLKPEFAYRDIVGQYFGTAEQQYIATVPNPPEAFFLLWTRKEALLKATGKGIDDNLIRVPALNGKHALPADYKDTDWLAESLKTGSNCIMSVTYASTRPMKLQLGYLN